MQERFCPRALRAKAGRKTVAATAWRIGRIDGVSFSFQKWSRTVFRPIASESSFVTGLHNWNDTASARRPDAGAGPMSGLLGGKDQPSAFDHSPVIEYRGECPGTYLPFRFMWFSASLLNISNSFRHLEA